MNVLVCIEPPAPGPAARRALAFAAQLGPPARIAVVCARGERERPPLHLPRRAQPSRFAVVQHPAIPGLGPRHLGDLLARAARHLEASLVLAGSCSAGRGLGATGAATAHALGWPYLARIESLALAGEGAFPTAALVELRSGGKLARLRVPLPAVLTVAPSGATERRRRTSGSAADEAPATEWLDPAALGVAPDAWGLPDLPTPSFTPFAAQIPVSLSGARRRRSSRSRS